VLVVVAVTVVVVVPVTVVVMLVPVTVVVVVAVAVVVVVSVTVFVMLVPVTVLVVVAVAVVVLVPLTVVIVVSVTLVAVVSVTVVVVVPVTVVDVTVVHSSEAMYVSKPSSLIKSTCEYCVARKQQHKFQCRQNPTTPTQHLIERQMVRRSSPKCTECPQQNSTLGMVHPATMALRRPCTEPTQQEQEHAKSYCNQP
jgi:hypothetical protein